MPRKWFDKYYGDDMKVKDKLQELGINANEADFSDILAALKTDDLSIKKDEVGTNLAMLLAYSGTTRSELAGLLGWEKSRISRILSGMENLTLRTIHDVCKAIGYEFDVTFRREGTRKPMQPWQTLEIAYEPLEHLAYIMNAKPVKTGNSAVNFLSSPVANDEHWRFTEQLSAY